MTQMTTVRCYRVSFIRSHADREDVVVSKTNNYVTLRDAVDDLFWEFRDDLNFQFLQVRVADARADDFLIHLGRVNPIGHVEYTYVDI